MKAVLKAKPAPGLELQTVPNPKPGPGEVILKVEAASMCGTDSHIYRWDDWSQQHIQTPRIIGHEMCGEIVEIGKDVTTVKVGDKIAAESHVTCGKCFQCRTGNAHVCKHCEILGIDRDGSFADYVALPEQVCWSTAPEIPPDLACLQESLGNSVHAALAEDITGHTLLVTGCGPTGLFAIAVARTAGAATIIATDVSEYRLDLARKVGADLAFNPQKTDAEVIWDHTDGEGVDGALEMSGHPSAVRLSLRFVKNAGHVVLFGIPAEPIPIDVANDVIFKGVRIHGITGRRLFDTWYRISGLFKAGLNIAPIVTHRIPLEEFETGFELIHSGQCGKVVLIP